MSRAAITLWQQCPGADWSFPQRSALEAVALDRRLAALLGRLRASFARFEQLRLERFARQVSAAALPLAALELSQLKSKAGALRLSLLREGVTPSLAVQAFALAGEASARVLGKRPYPVQNQGGYGILRGRLIEMATGEGKTLTALLPAVTMALAGIPVHVVTVNDYLARRDAATLGPVFALFGLTVGVVTHEEDDDARRLAYQADITYCVNKDLVFDYLRDTLERKDSISQTRRQRGLYFAIVDEADGVLVDEARTPLVIARERHADAERERAVLALQLARALAPGHFTIEQQGRQYRLNAGGRAFLRRQDAALAGAPADWRIARICDERVEQALCALYSFNRGSNYVVLEEKIQIVDEFTGRILPDRSWERGLHQMIEVKEGLAATAPRDTIARQTYPQFFARYLRIGGMSGTAREIAPEIEGHFGMRLVAIPTNRPCQRRHLGLRLYTSSAQRWKVIAQRALELAISGRAVLIGTRSVRASEEISAVLDSLNQVHLVLNALQNAHEAAIIAQAGLPGRITVATNMAGRGTDIDLGEATRAAGGLHVILTELHESRRIDRQLYGRAGRQGDPGSCEAIVSLEDELFVRFAPHATVWLAGRAGADGAVPRPYAAMLHTLAQGRAERHNAAVRRDAASRESAMRGAMAFSGSKT